MKKQINEKDLDIIIEKLLEHLHKCPDTDHKNDAKEQIIEEVLPELKKVDDIISLNNDAVNVSISETPIKRRRGRPRKMSIFKHSSSAI